QLLEEPETPFYHDWTFTVSEDDRSVHVAAKITLGSPRLSYSFMVPDNFSAINIQAEGVEVTEIKEDDKKRYVCEFETEEEKEFTFEVEFDLENWVKVKHVRDEVYSFSWKYTIYHSASHTVEIILYEKHEILSGGPDQDQVYVPFTKEAPELTPFEFEVTFSKKGKELIEEGENLFEQGKQTGSMKTCVEARDKYTEAINFYSKYLAPMINDQNINIFLGSLRAEKENINIFLKEWDEAENSLNDARSFLTKGSFKEAIEYAERAGVIYEKLGYKKEKADCMLVTARAYLEGKNFEKALEYVGLAKTVYEGIDYEPGIENSEELIREIEAAWMWWRIIIIIETILIVSALSIGIYQRKSIKPIFSRTMGEIYHLIKFRKILNPYIAGPPIKSEKMFFGREDVFTFIKKKFSAEKKNIAIFLYAERKTGKTSVLYQIENRRLGKEFIPVHIDIQEMAGVKSEKEFLQKVTTKIVESLEKFRVIHHGSREYSEINALIKEYDTKQNPYSVFDEVLDRASQVSKKKYLILMFDEYDLLRKKVESEGMSLDIVQYIRHLIQKRERLAFIFTGSEYRLKTGAKEWDLMLGCAIPKKIDFLTRDDALDLMKIPVGYKIDYKEEAVNKIIRLTGCHPFFLQLFLQNLVYHLNKTKKYGVEVADINQVLKYSLENASPHLSFIWKDSEPGERIVLSALAELIKSEDQYVSVEEVIDELQARKEKLQEIREIREERIIKKAFSRLVDKKILERKGEAMYNFKADFLRYWVENEHPLFRTLEDIEENIRGGEKNEPIY
ncbi:MAG: tetratricopeptide repeat protein, partial [Theionarchaea archaeon]|nr:tetratricopeptide repeat protein [Theionarchaea archaeon]